jgi:hypothetical protein
MPSFTSYGNGFSRSPEPRGDRSVKAEVSALALVTLPQKGNAHTGASQPGPGDHRGGPDEGVHEEGHGQRRRSRWLWLLSLLSGSQHFYPHTGFL